MQTKTGNRNQSKVLVLRRERCDGKDFFGDHDGGRGRAEDFEENVNENVKLEKFANKSYRSVI